MLQMQRTEEISVSRDVRGVQAFGSFFSWCCDLVTHGQISPVQKDIQNLAHTMKELVSSQSILEGNVENAIGQFRNFSSYVHDSFTQLEEKHRLMRYYQARMEDDIRTELHLVLIMSQISTALLDIVVQEMELRHGLSECSKGYLSQFLLSKDALDQQVSAMLRQESFKGLKYSLNGTNLIYSDKLAHCTVSNNSLNIWVKIPLTRGNRSWKIIRFIPIPFTWKTSVCSLFPQGIEMLAAVSVDQIFLFEGVEKEHCLENPICLIPRVNAVFSEAGQCISAVKSKVTVADAVPYCQFHCYPSSTPKIIQVAPDQFILSAPSNLSVEVQCNTKIVEHNSIGFGAYRFVIPGNCSLEIGSRTAIAQREVMPSYAASGHAAEFLVPAFWTTHLGAELDNLQNLDTSPKFSRNTDVVNESWANHMPTFYVPKPLKVIEIPEVSSDIMPAYHFFPGEDLILVILLACIVGLLCLLYMAVIILYFKIRYVNSIKVQKEQDTVPLRKISEQPATQSEMTPLQLPRHRRLALPPPPTSTTSM